MSVIDKIAVLFGLIFFLALVLIPLILNEDTNSDQKAAQTQETIENNKEEIKKNRRLY